MESSWDRGFQTHNSDNIVEWGAGGDSNKMMGHFTTALCKQERGGDIHSYIWAFIFYRAYTFGAFIVYRVYTFRALIFKRV